MNNTGTTVCQQLQHDEYFKALDNLTVVIQPDNRDRIDGLCKRN